MTETRHHLETLFADLPDDLYGYLWVLSPGGTKTTRSFRDPDVAAGWVREFGPGVNVYAGVSLSDRVLPAHERVKNETAAGLVALGGDVDFGKRGCPRDEAAARGIIAAMPLPPTLVVASGHGLQPWWIFNEAWGFTDDDDREMASLLSAAWQRLLLATAAAHGYTIDAVGDLARVLRVAGTVNVKDPAAPVPVQLLDGDGPRCNPEDLYHLPELFPHLEAEEAARRPRADTTTPTPTGGGRYGEAALASEVAQLAATPPGVRNNAARDAAFRMGRLVAGGELAEKPTLDALNAAVAGWGVDQRAVRKTAGTIKRALEAGERLPRCAPPRAAIVADPDQQAAAHGAAPERDSEDGEETVQPPAPSLPYHTTAAHMAEVIGEQEWLWPRWLPVGHISLMAAKRGVGKSALALWLENCVATGGPWPDGSPGAGEPGYALHIETEGFQGGHRERMMAWGVDMEQIIYLGEDGMASLTLEDPKALQAVQALASHYCVKLIVIDALRRATKGDENDSRLASILADWQNLARDMRCCILLLHHMGKGYDGTRPPLLDDLRGTSGIGDVARSALGLWVPDPTRPGAVSVLQMKASLLSAEEAEEAGFAFEWDPLGGLDFDIPQPAEAHDENLTDLAEKLIVEIIRANAGTAQRAEILKAGEGRDLGRGPLDRAAKRLKERGVITKTPDGKWGLLERRMG